MVNLKKGGKQAKKAEKPVMAEKSKEIGSKDGNDNVQETTKPAAKRDARNKASVKTTEAPERKSRRGEKEAKMEEEMEEVAEETFVKRVNGRKRKADEKESEDVEEKESKSKKSKQVKVSEAGSEDQKKENDREELQPEKEPLATKTEKGRKTTDKNKVEETDKESATPSEKSEETKGISESDGEDKIAEVPKTKKREKDAQKGKTEKDAEEDMEDAEVEEMVADKRYSKAKDVKKGTKNTKAGKEQTNRNVESETKLATTNENVAETSKGEAAKGNSEANEDKKDSNAKGGKKVVRTAESSQNTTEDDKSEAEPPKKKACVTSMVSHASHCTAAGFVLTVGEGDTGQLGLGPDVQERGKPGKVELPSDAVQVCAGGMHSVCLTVTGEVYTFGCNDEGSLGRPTKEEEDCMEPGKVDIPEKIVLVSAGDSHTAALSELGQVYIWGTFRDANGSIGILPGCGKLEKPEKILPNVVIVKIASGCDHLVCLTAGGDIYTMGAAEQGQLGRVAECFSVRGGRKGVEMLLVPTTVKCNRRNQRFRDVWTGQYVTFAKTKDTGEIYAWGLNNYYQLGFPDMRNKFVPEKSKTFEKSKDWKEISGGQHHTVALDKDGLVYSLGRKDYGRLGLGSENLEEKSAPTLIASMKEKKCIKVNCGSAVSFAVDEDGKIYGWGMGSSKQLGQGGDEEDIYEPKHITSKLLDDKRGLMVSAGGQHTIFLAQNRS